MIGDVHLSGRPWRLVVAPSVGLAIVHAPLVALPGAWDVALSLILVMTTVLVARNQNLTFSDIGLARHRLGAGVVWGVGSVLVLIIGYGVLLALPATRDAINDFGTSAGSNVWVTALVLIPLRTVLAEELLFRGVLWGLIERRAGANWALSGTAIAFGAWHVAPALSLAGRSDTAIAPAVIGVLLFTTAAGLLLGYLRRASDSLVAPIMFHWASNALGVVAVYVV